MVTYNLSKYYCILLTQFLNSFTSKVYHKKHSHLKEKDWREFFLHKEFRKMKDKYA